MNKESSRGLIEMNMERIRILQQHKKELTEEINSNINRKDKELITEYKKLENIFNELIFYEAKVLGEFNE